MAISVNEVYQTVLAIANKENRGYITPQEFNLFANQAQIDIFNEYLYDLDASKRPNFSYNGSYSSKSNLTQDKLMPFKHKESVTSGFNYNAQYYNRVISVENDLGNFAQEVDFFDVAKILNKPLLKPTRNRPIWYQDYSGVYMEPSVDETGADITYTIGLLFKPTPPSFGYVVVNDKPLYNFFTSNDFMLIETEKPKLVNKILQYAGVLLKDNTLIQAATAEEVKTIQSEKQ
jgi:hypothetical protein